MKPVFVLIVALIALFAPAAHAEEKAKHQEDFFPLGLWYEGGVGAARDNVLPADPAAAAPIYDKNFADIAAHGVNVIAVPNSRRRITRSSSTPPRSTA
jgi:hypothetical protein